MSSAMDGPDSQLSNISAEIVKVIMNRARALGLTWTLRIATVATTTPLTAVYDGDTEALAMTSMIGSLGKTQRAYVIAVPPSGNFVIGIVTSGWATWAPSWTNLTVGNGLLVARYKNSGDAVDYQLMLTTGTTTSVGGLPLFTLPVLPAATYGTGGEIMFPGEVHLLSPGVANRFGMLKRTTGSTIIFPYWDTATTLANVGPGAPWAWTAGKVLTFSGRYEPA